MNAHIMNGDLIYKDTRTFAFDGAYHLDRKKDILDFNLDFDHTDIQFANAFMDPQVVSNIEELTQEISLEKSSHGTGGMQSKIQAATIAQNASIETWIVNGLKDNFITDALNGISNYTKISSWRTTYR